MPKTKEKQERVKVIFSKVGKGLRPWDGNEPTSDTEIICFTSASNYEKYKSASDNYKNAMCGKMIVAVKIDEKYVVYDANSPEHKECKKKLFFNHTELNKYNKNLKRILVVDPKSGEKKLIYKASLKQRSLMIVSGKEGEEHIPYNPKIMKNVNPNDFKIVKISFFKKKIRDMKLRQPQPLKEILDLQFDPSSELLIVSRSNEQEVYKNKEQDLIDGKCEPANFKIIKHPQGSGQAISTQLPESTGSSQTRFFAKPIPQTESGRQRFDSLLEQVLGVKLAELDQESGVVRFRTLKTTKLIDAIIVGDKKTVLSSIVHEKQTPQCFEHLEDLKDLAEKTEIMLSGLKALEENTKTISSGWLAEFVDCKGNFDSYTMNFYIKPIVVAVLMAKNTEILDILFQHQAIDINLQQPGSGFSLLQLFVKRPDAEQYPDVFQYLLSKEDLDPTLKDKGGKTVVHNLIEKGLVRFILSLIEQFRGTDKINALFFPKDEQYESGELMRLICSANNISDGDKTTILKSLIAPDQLGVMQDLFRLGTGRRPGGH